jgi:hypothetical protein
MHRAPRAIPTIRPSDYGYKELQTKNGGALASPFLYP